MSNYKFSSNLILSKPQCLPFSIRIISKLNPDITLFHAKIFQHVSLRYKLAALKNMSLNTLIPPKKVNDFLISLFPYFIKIYFIC